MEKRVLREEDWSYGGPEAVADDYSKDHRHEDQEAKRTMIFVEASVLEHKLPQSVGESSHHVREMP